MTNLECTAQNCVNNRDRLCRLNGIEVHGEDACRCRETCCGNFSEAFAGFGNSIDAFEIPAGEETEVGCDAKRCVYNAGGVCDAEEVMIDGSYAHRMDATCCDTFIEKD
jgi:hypothetical protein